MIGSGGGGVTLTQSSLKGLEMYLFNVKDAADLFVQFSLPNLWRVKLAQQKTVGEMETGP